MAAFNLLGELPAAAVGANAFPNAGATLAIGANRSVMLRNVRCVYQKVAAGAGNMQFLITVTDAVTAAVLAQWRTILALAGAGIAETPGPFGNPDRMIFFQSGANGATITLSVIAAIINDVARMSVSGQYIRG